MNPLRSHHIDVNDVTLHLEEQGQGDPLLILHGFTGSTRSMAAVTSALASQHRAISLDLVGHGKSSAPKSTEPYSMKRCIEQVACVLRARDAWPAHVLGYSMGGRAALSLLAGFPEAVRSLVLVGASAGLERPDERAERISKDEALAQRIETHGLEPFVDEWMALPLFASQTARLGAAALRGAREQRMASEAHGLANSLRGMGTGAQPALHAALHAMRAPVLFAVGDEDLKFKKIAQDLRSKLQTARIAMIPAAGHAAHLENPEAFLRVAADFLTKATEFS